MSDPSVRNRRRWLRAAATPLLVAWLVVLALLGAGAAYIFLDDEQAPSDWSPSTASSTAVVLALPARPAADSAAPTTTEALGEAPTTENQPAWQRHAVAFDAPEDRPLVAVVVTGLGLSRTTTQAAIEQLPASVTLSFSTYGRDLGESIALARSLGHEVMLDLPMAPENGSGDDPGPLALAANAEASENLTRLRTILSRAEGYVGLAGTMGANFFAAEPQARPVLQDLAEQGLILLDSGAAEGDQQTPAADLGLTYARGDAVVDAGLAGGTTIDARLARIERLALDRGSAVVLCRALPTCIARLQAWSGELADRGLALAPISALVKQRAAP